ncbi:hypothetical protein C8R47DRAFT_1154863 [Mycena vitilis]|nr:hypothetical protein C8R47DRAFT_1154863 [Mycena vitilis]
MLLPAPLIVAAVFRTATIRRSPEPFWHQQFAFLGGCSTSNPPYTAWRILVNRSLGRPLVRGESSGIIVVRGLILSGVIVALPIFAVYSIVLIPLQAKVRTDTLSIQIEDAVESISDTHNVTILFDAQLSSGKAVTWVETTSGTVLCPASTVDGLAHLIVAECPAGWWQNTITISITFAAADLDWTSIFSVYPGVGDLDRNDINSLQLNDLLQFTEPIPVIPGVQLFAHLKWTSRQIFRAPTSRLFGAFIAMRTVWNMEVSTLFNTNSVHTPDSLSSTLTLVQREPWGTKFLQDSAATPIDGISAFGGAWTFINGTFVLFFGANVLYFAFGRRPLSALGLAHLLQRRTLTRKWHEDFPALQTEGGKPGSESAGIVAFIRERLVDIEPIHGDSETQTIVGDVELQEMIEDGSNQATTVLEVTPHINGDDIHAPLHL